MTAAVYEASHIKRNRATREEVLGRRQHLRNIVADMRPMTVRQVYYQATVRNIIDKTEAGYNKVQTDLVQMRKSGALPYSWLADNTRWQRKPDTFDSVEQALQDTAKFYRKSLWRLPRHRHVRRTADGGARLRKLVLPSRCRRLYRVGVDKWFSRYRFHSIEQAEAGALALSDFLGADYRAEGKEQ